MKFVGLINQKGGVAKSTIASSLAIYYTHVLGMDVNLLDLDETNRTQYLTFFKTADELRRPLDKSPINGKLVINDSFVLKEGMINICDFPCNLGLEKYVDVIDSYCGVPIFPSTYDARDLDLLVTNTLPSFTNLSNKVIMFVKTKQSDVNDPDKDVSKLISLNKHLILRTGLKNAPKFYDDFIRNDSMSCDDIAARLNRLKDFRTLVKFINNKILNGSP